MGHYTGITLTGTPGPTGPQGPSVEYVVTAHGALGDGVTDDTTAIQNAINAVAALGGGVVFFPPGAYKITATLTLADKRGVVLRGSGGSNEPYSAALNIGTRLLWYGAAGGTMVSTGATAAATEYGRNQGVEDMTLNGRDLAGTGLLITSGWFGSYRRLHITTCTTVHLDITTIPVSASIGEDSQFNLFEQVSTRPSAGASANAIGVRLDSGATPQATQGNTSLNDFIDCFFGHYNGVGVQIKDADSNRFLSLTTHSNSGTGIGVELCGSAVVNYGYARSNIFYNIDPTGSSGGIVARGTASYPTQSSARNRILNLNQENDLAFKPTIETGASLYWTGSFTAGNWPQSPGEILARAEGLLGQNYDRQVIRALVAPTDGTVYFMLAPFRMGEIVTNLHLHIGVGGGTVTLSKMGLYKTDGTRVALSADQGTGWQSATTKTAALTAPYTIPADGGYFIAFVAKASVSMPTLGSVAGSAVTAVGSGAIPFLTQAGQTDLPSPAVFANVGSTGFWVGWS